MKKKIFVAAVAAIVAVGAAWNLNQANKSDTLSDLTLSNVEALASESNCPGGSCTSFGCNACCSSGKNPSCSWGTCTCN